MTIPSQIIPLIWDQLESPYCSVVANDTLWDWYYNSPWNAENFNEITREYNLEFESYREAMVNELLLILVAEGETIHYD